MRQMPKVTDAVSSPLNKSAAIIKARALFANGVGRPPTARKPKRKARA